jgi:hypothetical protein
LSKTAAPASGFTKGDLYRICRMLHAYISAAAFLMLILFSVTGILLNHPEWEWTSATEQSSTTVQLTPAEVAAVRAAPEPGRALAAAVGAKTPLLGGFESGDLYDDQASARLAGPKGASDLTGDLATGAVEVSRRRTGFVTLMSELHRGRGSGGVWRAIIDISAVAITLLSMIGYVLFFSLRFRLRTSLILTATSLLVMVGVVVWLIP